MTHAGPDAPSPARALVRTLEGLGATHVYGLPGSGNLALFEELRRSGIRTVAPAHELSAAFMANGHHRASGRPGVVVAVAGPGFAFSLAGLAEARLDSAAVLCVTGAHPGEAEVGRRFQELPQRSLAEPVVKACYRVRSPGEAGGTLERAWRATLEGEPGPVLLEIEDPVWSGGAAGRADDGGEGAGGDDGAGGGPGAGRSEAGTGGAAGGDAYPAGGTGPAAADPDTAAGEAAGRLLDRLSSARRPVLLVGQGAQDAPEALRRVAEALSVPVLATTSGRGALPEDHALSFALDRLPEGLETARRIVAAADVVACLGCGLSHNATWGFRLELPEEKLVRVDASRAALEDPAHPASEALEADVPAVLRAVAGRMADDGAASGSPDAGGGGWSPGDLEAWRASPSDREASEGLPAPRLAGGLAPGAFFAELREALPREACVVTDSGHHEMLVRRHLSVLAPRGLVVPADLQSMGFGVPAAVGAALARPDRPVVAVVGDGGLRATGVEMATAGQEGADLVVVVLVDGQFGLIRRQQLQAHGRTEGTRLPALDAAAFAEALGVRHRRVESGPGPPLRAALEEGGVHLLEVPVEDGPGTGRRALARRLKEDARNALGPGAVARMKRWRTALAPGAEEGG